MNRHAEERLRQAAIRIASRTRDPRLRRKLVTILGADALPRARTARFEEGKHVDVPKWLRDHGYDEAADQWEANIEEYGDQFKRTAGRTFPILRKRAMQDIVAYCGRNPRSVLARESSAVRAAVASLMVDRWVRSAVQQWSTSEYLQAPRREIRAALRGPTQGTIYYPPVLFADALQRQWKRADAWHGLPPGWTPESRKKMWRTLTKRAPKHPVKRCIKQMEGKVSDPGAFCGALSDRVRGKKWRSEARGE